MKKTALLLCLLAALLAGCAGAPDTPEPPEEAEPETPRQLETLAVEISREGQSAGTLLDAAQRLPELLKTCFAESAGVEIGEITVTVGASPAATLQAMEAGSVDVAFVPAEALAESQAEVTAILADAPQPALSCESALPEDWNAGPTVRDETAPWPAGTFALICTAPTDYGAQLAGRTDPTWEELDHARWGVLAADSLAGSRCLDLWLADRCEGNDLTDLSDVTVYADTEALFRAAATGEIDAFPIPADARMDVADAWTRLPEETAEDGVTGFGREASVWDEVRVIGVTERLYTAAAAVARSNGTLQEAWFAQALSQALESLGADQPDLAQLFGAARFGGLDGADLDPLRRLLTMEQGRSH